MERDSFTATIAANVFEKFFTQYHKTALTDTEQDLYNLLVSSIKQRAEEYNHKKIKVVDLTEKEKEKFYRFVPKAVIKKLVNGCKHWKLLKNNYDTLQSNGYHKLFDGSYCWFSYDSHRGTIYNDGVGDSKGKFDEWSNDLYYLTQEYERYLNKLLSAVTYPEWLKDKYYYNKRYNNKPPYFIYETVREAINELAVVEFKKHHKDLLTKPFYGFKLPEEWNTIM